MEDIQIEFEYSGNKIQVFGKEDDTMKNIIDKFFTKTNLNLERNELFYLYNGENLDALSNTTLNKIMTKEDYKNGTMKIISYNNNNNYLNQNDQIFKLKSKYIICPKCEENCLLEIKNYKYSLYGCKNGHKISNLDINEFEESQKIDQTKINCDFCKSNKKSDTYNNIFYKCLTCSKNMCLLCKNEHEDDHLIIDYDRKNNICNEHNRENFISYCKKCNVNLCFICEDEHNDHEIIKLSKYRPNLKIINTELEEFKTKILKVQKIIDELIQTLNNVKEGLEKLLNINIDMKNNYNLDNRSYQLFMNVNNIRENIKLKEVDELLTKNNIYEQFKILLNIHDKMTKKEFNMETPMEAPMEAPMEEPKYENGICNKKELNLEKTFNSKKISNPKENFTPEKITDPKNITYYENVSNSKKILNTEIEPGNEMESRPKNTINSINYKNGLNSKSILNPKSQFNPKSRIIPKKNNKIINYNNNPKSYSEITIKYKINPKDSKIRIFGESFVNNNYNNCIIFYDNTEDKLMEYFDTKKINIKNDELEIKLKQTGEITNLGDMFENCESLKSLPDICNFDTSHIINMSGMFRGCKSLCEISDISKWNTENVKNMNGMFNGCKSLNKLPDISKWDISNVIDFSWMFFNCKSLESLPDLSKWNIRKDAKVEMMFTGCKSYLIIPDKFLC